MARRIGIAPMSLGFGNLALCLIKLTPYNKVKLFYIIFFKKQIFICFLKKEMLIYLKFYFLIIFMNYSILKINFILLSFLVVFILWAYFTKDIFLSFSLFIIFIILLLIILIFLNYFFYIKYIDLINNINLTISNNWYIDIKKLWTKKHFFKEHNDIQKEIKKYILKANVDKKDLDETKKIFEKFISKELYDNVWDKWYDRIVLWNFKLKKITIIFLDIVWFTSMSEKMPQKNILKLLNVYFDWIWEIVSKYKWYIDKYLWDGIMIIFDEWNELEAFESTIEIQKFVSQFKITEVWKKLNVWIWINFWEVVIWTVWSKNRMEVTVIGDSVNTASRIQSLTRDLNKWIIFSHDFYEKIKLKTTEKILFLGTKKLKWKNKEVKIYWLSEYII